jgi:hypoxanthine phosphoribosyltransferase
MRMLWSAEEIAGRVRELGQELTERYRGKPLVVIGVLNGGVIFFADLVRQLDGDLELAFVRASSYRGAATTPGALVLEMNHLPELRGRHVLIVDEICDSGTTLARLKAELAPREPASLATAVLLWKRCRTVEDFAPDFVAWEVPDEFVVGYGLDHQGRFRHWPAIYALETGDLAMGSADSA